MVVKMETKYSIKNYSTLVVEEVIPEKVIPAEVKEAKEYDYTFLIKQKADIQKQWDEMIAQKNKEIEEINAARQKEMDFVDAMIAKADELGVKEDVKPLKEIPLEEIINGQNNRRMQCVRIERSTF
jgi:5-enolpyruvylshikimate-3-phosphate synthase